MQRGPVGEPCSIVCAPDGLVYVADRNRNSVRCIDRQNRRVSTLAGAGLMGLGHRDGVGAAAMFSGPAALVHHEGKLYVSDSINLCIRCVVISTGKSLELVLG